MNDIEIKQKFILMRIFAFNFHTPIFPKAQDDLAGKGVGICSTLIRLEIMSPDVCDLTLIDLPGITRVPVSGQPEDISVQVKKNFGNKKK